MIQQGTYRGIALSGGLGYTAAGKEQVGVDFVITEGEYEGTHATWYGYFTDKTTDRTIETLRVCGWEGDDLCDLSGIEKNPVDLQFEVEEYTDNRTGEVRERSRIRWVNRPSGGGLQMRDKMDAGQAAAFAAKMRGRVVALKGGNRAPAPPPARPQPKFPANPERAAQLKQEIADDDIPF